MAKKRQEPVSSEVDMGETLSPDADIYRVIGAVIAEMDGVDEVEVHTGGIAIPGLPPIGRKLRGIKLSYDSDSLLTVDLYLTAAYGTVIPEIAWEVQRNVTSRLAGETGSQVKKVNIHIQGVTAE